MHPHEDITDVTVYVGSTPAALLTVTGATEQARGTLP